LAYACKRRIEEGQELITEGHNLHGQGERLDAVEAPVRQQSLHLVLVNPALNKNLENYAYYAAF
jgi:hypothetical protein